MLLVPEVKNVVEVNSKVMLQNEPTLFALNFVGDTTALKKWQDLKGESQDVYASDDTILPKYNLKIIIDTTYDFHSKGFVYLKDKWPRIEKGDWEKYNHKIPSVEHYFGRQELMRKQYVSSYPVLIYNNSNEKALIFQPFGGGDCCIIQEAIDTDGKWKPIEYRYWMNSCITGMSLHPLLPKRYMATSTIKYHGEFKTKIRLKFYTSKKIYYSNTITGNINRSQFTQDFIEAFLKDRGAYEPEYFEEDKQRMFLNFTN